MTPDIAAIKGCAFFILSPLFRLNNRHGEYPTIFKHRLLYARRIWLWRKSSTGAGERATAGPILPYISTKLQRCGSPVRPPEKCKPAALLKLGVIRNWPL
jgi:hypothetical protein